MRTGIDRNPTDTTKELRGIRSSATTRLSEREVTSFVTKARAGKASGKLSDGGGLFLGVAPVSGKALWRLRYRMGEKDTLLALGTFPAVSLKEARRKAQDGKFLIEQGRDPVTERRKQRIAATASIGRTFAD